jgi:hypothetical protein
MEGSRFIQIEASKWKQKVDHFFHFIRSPKKSALRRRLPRAPLPWCLKEACLSKEVCLCRCCQRDLYWT